MLRPHCTNDPCRVESKFLGSERCFSYLCQMRDCVQLFATPWTVAYQALLSMGFYRQEYWSGLPFPSPGDLPNPGIEPISPVASSLQADSLPLEPSGPLQNGYYSLYMEDACHEMTATITVENDNGLWLGKNWGNMPFLFPDINSLLLVFHPSLIMAIIKLRLSPARKHFKRKKNTCYDS